MQPRRVLSRLVTLLRARFARPEAPFGGPTLIDQVPELLREAGRSRLPSSAGR